MDCRLRGGEITEIMIKKGGGRKKKRGGSKKKKERQRTDDGVSYAIKTIREPCISKSENAGGKFVYVRRREGIDMPILEPKAETNSFSEGRVWRRIKETIDHSCLGEWGKEVKSVVKMEPGREKSGIFPGKGRPERPDSNQRRDFWRRFRSPPFWGDGRKEGC